MEQFRIIQNQNITLPEKIKDTFLVDLLKNYSAGINWNISFHNDETTILVGDATKTILGDNEYVINVTENGVFIGGTDYNATIRGYVTFLEMIFAYGKSDYRVKCGEIQGNPPVKFRCVHLCLFPEFTLENIRKLVRFCGISKYTHIILETWGSIKLDTLKELSWPQGHSKADIKELIDEAKLLGMKVIPFFQHLGHASLSRLGYSGKHVVLDQNPELEYMYYPESYGWVWNFKDPDIRKFLKDVREELMDLFSDSDYFHLGCDESGIKFDTDELASYLNEVNADLKAKGKRAIIWGDMLLSHDFFPDEKEIQNPLTKEFEWTKYDCNSSVEYANSLLNKLDKDILIADWQYNTISQNWATARLLKEKGFEVICCPWNLADENLNGSISTITENNLYGLMETTWNTPLTGRGLGSMMYLGLKASGDHSFKRFDGHVGYIVERTHTTFRKISGKFESYDKCGWHATQVEY